MKVVSDTGWVGQNSGIRCYSVSTRDVVFESVRRELVEFVALYERQTWYGQEFDVRIEETQSGLKLHMRRAVDSGG